MRNSLNYVVVLVGIGKVFNKFNILHDENPPQSWCKSHVIHYYKDPTWKVYS